MPSNVKHPHKWDNKMSLLTVAQASSDDVGSEISLPLCGGDSRGFGPRFVDWLLNGAMKFDTFCVASSPSNECRCGPVCSRTIPNVLLADLKGFHVLLKVTALYNKIFCCLIESIHRFYIGATGTLEGWEVCCTLEKSCTINSIYRENSCQIIIFSWG